MDPDDGKSRKKKKEENKTKKKKPRGPKRPPRIPIEKVKLSVPNPDPEWKRHGTRTFLCLDARIEVRVIEYEREVWRKPDGSTVTAPLPEGLRGHLSPSLVFLILILYHQGRMTSDGITRLLRNIGLDIDKRTVIRVLLEGNEIFEEEAVDVLRAGLETAMWLGIDDTGMRHKGKTAHCTQIANDFFTFFFGSDSKSRLNILNKLNLDRSVYEINDAALDYLVRVGAPKTAIERLTNSNSRIFEDDDTWKAHLGALRITGEKTIRLVTEAALWGAADSLFNLSETVFVTDEAPQFNFAPLHLICWVHLERQYHKLIPANDEQERIIDGIRDRIWDLYAKLKQYCAAPSDDLKADIETTFDALFGERTGIRSLDELLEKTQQLRPKLLLVLKLDYKGFPQNTNSIERDMRDPASRRKVSAGTRSASGRLNRHAGLTLKQTCEKNGIAFSDYLANRLKVPNAPHVPPLAEVIRQRAAEDQQPP